MLGARVGRLVGDAGVGVEAAIDVLAVVDRGEPFDVGLHAVGQRVVGGVGVGEQRVAAARRTLLEVEDRAHRRLLLARHVGVPTFAVGALGARLGADDHQLGKAGFVRRRRMDVKLAEQPPEREVLLGRDLLIAKEDDQVLDQRAVDLALLLGGERPRQIDAAELGADQRSELLDGEGPVRGRGDRGWGDAGAVPQVWFSAIWFSAAGEALQPTTRGSP